MVEVRAPSTLPEGYQFPATVGNKTFMVTVPRGGIQERQTFSVPMPRDEDLIHQRVNVPVGEWRDGFWDLFEFGYCHATVFNSCCCVPSEYTYEYNSQMFDNNIIFKDTSFVLRNIILTYMFASLIVAVGQVISRLQLTWMGEPTNSVFEATGAFKRILLLVAGYWILRGLMLIIIANLDPNAKFDGSHPDHTKYEEPSNWYYFFCALDDVFWYSYFAYSVFLLRKVRYQVRTKYAIPEADLCPKGCEDLCCSLVCPCFTAGQLLRHTTNYDEYDGKCCTSTGLPKHVPAIV